MSAQEAAQSDPRSFSSQDRLAEAAERIAAARDKWGWKFRKGQEVVMAIDLILAEAALNYPPARYKQVTVPDRKFSPLPSQRGGDVI